MSLKEICQAIALAAGAISAMVLILGYTGKMFGWLQKQNSQDEKISDLRKHHDEDTRTINEELQLLTYGILACLKGLSEQGCNGPVTEAITKIEKHLNERAHRQKGVHNGN